MNIAQIKRRLPLVKFLRSEGYDAQPTGEHDARLCCCLHRERTPSMRIYGKQNRYHCFGCGANGDIIDLVIALGYAQDTKQAVDFLSRRIKGVPKREPRPLTGSLTKIPKSQP